MLYSPKTCAGNKNINKRNWHRLVRLLVLTALAWPFATHATEIETPKIGLTSVPVEVIVSGVPAGATVTVSFAGRNYQANADDTGRAEFADLVADHAGAQTIVATAADESASANLRILPGWVSLMPAFV